MAIRPEYPTPDQERGQSPRVRQQPANTPAWYAPPRPLVAQPSAQPSSAQPPRRSKADSLELVRRLKGWLIAGSLVAFGVIGLLVKGNVTGVTAAAASDSSSQSPSSPSSTQQQPSSGGFFGQQGGSNFGPSSGSGGFGGGSFGSSSVS